MKKRLMAWLLVCFMLVGTLAVPVMAEEGENTPSFHDEGGGNEGGSNEGGGNEGGGNEGGGNEGGGNEGGSNEGGSNEGGSNEGGGNEGGGNEGGGNEGGSNEGGGNEGGGNEGGGNEGGGNEGDSNEGGSNEGGSNEGGGNEGGSNEGGGNEGGDNEGSGSGEGSGSESGGQDNTGCSHKWDEGKVVTASTCSAEGVISYYCPLCKSVKTEKIAKLEHKPNSYWVAKAAGHHHFCTACGAALELQDHYPGRAATETEDQICLTCGYIMTRRKGHIHEYDKNYSFDQTGHWHACSGCSEKGDFKEHTLKDVCTSVCSDCGFEIEPQHDYSGVWLSDETGHWMVCDGCGFTRKTEDHVPGEAATETHAQLCTVCGYELAPKLAPETIAPDDERVWQVNDTNHWKLDENGKKVGEGLHLWDEGMDRWDGKVVYTCKTCGAERTEGLTVTETEETDGGINFPFILLIVLVFLFVAATAALIIVLVMSKKKSKQYKGKFNR